MTISIDALPYECPFYGTPRQFMSRALAYMAANGIKGGGKAVITFGRPDLLGSRYSSPKQDEEHTCIDICYNGTDGKAAKCSIAVKSEAALPGSPPSLLYIEMRSGDWALLKSVVEKFLDHLHAGRLIGKAEPASAPVAAGPTAGSVVAGKGKPRKADPKTEDRTREPSEHDRIRTTLMTWARESGKCKSYTAAAACLGTITLDTRRNHERDGWLYSPEEMGKKGGYEDLWQLYTSDLRKS